MAADIPEHVEAIINRTLEHEGVLADDRHDPGGLTKWGIASRYHPEALDPAFTLADAKRIYYHEYYLTPRLYNLPVIIQPVVFDMGVNLGAQTAVRLLQAAVHVPADGKIGPITKTAASQANPTTLLTSLVESRILYYFARILESPSKQKFANGWVRRSLSFLT